MASRAPQGKSSTGNPNYAPVFAEPKQFIFKKWGSLDTSANRQALKDNDFAWIENWLQVGDANLQSLDGPSASLASTSGGDTIYEQFDCNLAGADTILNICTNGSGYSMPTANAPAACPITKFAPNGTFSGTAEQFAQWQNSFALFIGPTGGYWAWNGTTLIALNGNFTITGSTSGGNLLTVTASPAGFIISPGMTFTGAGLGTITIISYASGNGGNGTVNSANGTYNTSTTANVGSETITVTQTAPTAGSFIATYAGRVWIASGRTITYSAPGSFTDFTVADGGGAFIVSDEALYGTITALFATNDYLFFGGLTSINIISDVRIGTTAQITSTPTSSPTYTVSTLFNNTNISTNIGLPFNNACAGYLRSLVSISRRGPYILSGSSPQKLGNNLDGILPLIDFTKPISVGVVQVNLNSSRPGPAQNIIMWGCTYKDPTYGPRYIFLSFFDGKWFLASQLATLTPTVGAASLTNYVTLTNSVQAFYQGTPCMFGTDGTNIYQLYISDTQPLLAWFQTALWNAGDPTIDKQTMKLGLEANYPSRATGFLATADSETASLTYQLNNALFGAWLTATNVVSTWLTVTSVVSNWSLPNYAPIFTNVEGYGKYFGFTVYNAQSNATVTPGQNTIPGTLVNPAVDIAMNGVLCEYIERARW